MIVLFGMRQKMFCKKIINVSNKVKLQQIILYVHGYVNKP
jgi:hypothetical protein